MDITYDQVVNWLEAYGAAWENGDAEAAAQLFSPNAEYYETPFDPPLLGSKGVREYWQAQFYCHPNGANVELDGIFFLEFAATGLCMSLREWWHRREYERD